MLEMDFLNTWHVILLKIYMQASGLKYPSILDFCLFFTTVLCLICSLVFFLIFKCPKVPLLCRVRE